MLRRTISKMEKSQCQEEHTEKRELFSEYKELIILRNKLNTLAPRFNQRALIQAEPLWPWERGLAPCTRGLSRISMLTNPPYSPLSFDCLDLA